MQNRFVIIFIKKRICNVFYYLSVFYFLVAKIFNLTKPAKLSHKTTFKWWI